ncbi:hypothetical protein LPJ77_005065, partial [Coemansia sp. RSA 2523]
TLVRSVSAESKTLSKNENMADQSTAPRAVLKSKPTNTRPVLGTVNKSALNAK